MDIVKIDLSGINGRADLHALLKDKLGFPDYYGNNLDALADCLSDLHTRTYIVFSGYAAFRKAAGEYAEIFRTTVLRAEKENGRLSVCFI